MYNEVYEMKDDESENGISHLMEKYNWSYQEAMEYYYYGKYDEKDWEDYK